MSYSLFHRKEGLHKELDRTSKFADKKDRSTTEKLEKRGGRPFLVKRPESFQGGEIQKKENKAKDQVIQDLNSRLQSAEKFAHDTRTEYDQAIESMRNQMYQTLEERQRLERERSLERQQEINKLQKMLRDEQANRKTMEKK